MELFDTHCHLDLEAFEPDRADVLRRTRAAGVTRLLLPAVSRRRWRNLLHLCSREEGLFAALGLHPVFLEEHANADLDALEDAIVQHRPIAVGEIGLDYRSTDADVRMRQRVLLEAQLDIAARHGLPVILHSVRAQEDMLRTLVNFDLVGGICHAFNGSPEQARRFIERGFRLGFGGMLTYRRSNSLRRLAASLPVESLLLETDAPDMPGEGHRYQRNSPEYLPEILHVMAALRATAVPELAGQLLHNSCAALPGTCTATARG